MPLPPQVSLGYSNSEEGAARIYDMEALRTRGAQAHLNFPQQALSDVLAAATAAAAEHWGQQVRPQSIGYRVGQVIGPQL